MKHLAALARKYLMRQKYRTALTFACVLLSVFVFHLLCMAAVLIRGAALGSVIRETGNWEVNIQSWLQAMEQPEQAFPVLRAHPSVDTYQLYAFRQLRTSDERDSEGYLPYLTLAVNDSERVISTLSVNALEGDASLSGEMEDMAFGAGSMRFDLAKDEILLPADYSEAGFKEGDTVTITVTPMRGKPEEKTQTTETYIRYLIEQQGLDADTPWFSDSEGADGNAVLAMPLRSFLTEAHLSSELSYSESVSGTPYSVQMKIAGFFKGGTEYYHTNGLNMQLVTAADTNWNADAALADAWDALGVQADAIAKNSVFGAGFRVPEGKDFDSAVEALYLDLGLPQDMVLDYVHPVEKTTVYNTTLLALEFRGMDAITVWMDNFLPVTAALAVMAVLLWALMRFVIENAFEISVQERSAQFATLRIMGASRKQVALLVLMEALFYCVTAVPLGMLLAFGCKRIILLAVTRAGVPTADTGMPLLTAASLVFAWIAVLISSFTSSMWAARAYTPLEASRRTDLQGSKQGNIWNRQLFGSKSRDEKLAEQQRRFAQQSGDLKAPQKAKLNRRRSGFLLHYTLRNIRRTRKRFLIAVITMTIGCAVLSFGLSAGAWALMELSSSEDSFAEDFVIVQKSFSDEIAQSAESHFGSSEYFSDYRFRVTASSAMDRSAFAASFANLVPAEFLAEPEDAAEEIPIIILPRREYNTDYAVLTGIAYDDLAGWQCGILVYSSYGTGTESLSARSDSEKYAAGYTPVSSDVPVVQLTDGDSVPVCGMLCEKTLKWDMAILLPMDSAGGILSHYLLNSITGGDQPFSSEISLALADMNSYRAGLADATDYINNELSQYRGEVHLIDQFAQYTGRKALAVTVGCICLIALIGIWGVGICTVLNTINTSVLNRCDELMMLRMIGMSQKQMRKTVSLEGMLYSAAASLIGGLLGISGCVYMMMRSAFSASPLMVFGILFAALLVTAAVNLLIAKAAARPGLRTLNERLAAGNTVFR